MNIYTQTFNENFDDKKLYKKYQLDDEEIEFIEKMVHTNNEN